MPRIPIPYLLHFSFKHASRCADWPFRPSLSLQSNDLDSILSSYSVVYSVAHSTEYVILVQWSSINRNYKRESEVLLIAGLLSATLGSLDPLERAEVPPM